METPRIPALAAAYPEFRYMGSKHRLMPWVFEVLSPHCSQRVWPEAKKRVKIAQDRWLR